MSPALAGVFFTTSTPWKAQFRHIGRKISCTYGCWGKREGKGCLGSFDRYMVLCLKWITKKDLRYCDPRDCSPTGSSVHGILWAGILNHLSHQGSPGNSSVLCGSLDRRGVCGRRDICVCMAEFLRCPLETITTLVINYTPK